MESKFREILDSVNPEILENEEENLFESGVLDSLDVLALVASLEEGFGFDFEPTEVTSRNFVTVAAIRAVVSGHVGELK